MLLTRIGENSKIVVTGDVEQADRREKQNGLLDLCKRMQENAEGMTVCKLTGKDIQRHRIIDTVLDMYKED